MNNNIETRNTTTELRMIGTKLTGYAAKFNALSVDFGGWRERINPGAFKKTLAEGDVRAFWNHDDSRLPLGRQKSGTLHLEEDEIGLRFEVDLPETQDARDLIQSVNRGDVDGVSFGFRSRKDNWTEKGTIRTLLEVDLIEVSPVNFPAYPQTELALRSREEFLKNEAEEEEEPQEVLSEEDQKKKVKKMRAERILKILELKG